jgi:SAM-dependent methyltransferase
MSEIEHANKHHWDGKAKDYDTKPWQQTMINYIYGALAEHRDMFDLNKTTSSKQDYKLLDYACGPGTVTRSLLPYVTSIQAIDVSDGMVAEYNERSEKAGTTDIASAIQGNLLGDEPYVTRDGSKDLDIEGNPKLNDFDAVIVGLGFHHFSDWTGSLQKLALRVKPGGVVGIIDLEPSELVSTRPWSHDHKS